MKAACTKAEDLSYIAQIYYCQKRIKENKQEQENTFTFCVYVLMNTAGTHR